MDFDIASAIDSVIIIDDKKEEVSQLIEQLNKKSIQCIYIKQDRKRMPKIKMGNTLIIVDFELITGVGHTTNISKIREILQKVTKNIQVYGIAFWSKHANDDFDGNSDVKLFDELKSRIDSDILSKDLKNPPLYYVSIPDKNEYLNGSRDWKNIFSDFYETLESNKMAKYYFRWSYLAKNSVYEAFTRFNSILSDYKYSDKEAVFRFLLYFLSKNRIGYLEEDKQKLATYSYRALLGILENVIKEKADTINNCDVLELFEMPFNAKSISNNTENINFELHKSNIISGTQVLKTIAALNSIYAFDFNAKYAKETFMPGNIYKQPSNYTSTLDIGENEAIKILIEITPPCDHAQGNCNQPKFLEGIFCKDFSKFKKYTKASFYTFLHPIYYKGETYGVVIDLNSLYVGNLKLKKGDYIGRMHDSLFADVLQKYSSHISRLGVSFINNIKYR